MKRRASKLLLFLLLGAMVNVAVAWGFVASQNPKIIGAPSGPRKPMRLIDSPFDQLDFSGSSFNTVGLRATCDFEKREDAFGVIEQTEAGWPVLALDGRSKQTIDFGSNTPRQSYETSYAIPLRTPGTATVELGPSILPIKPIWPGFAINTIFYAAILWMLFVFPFRVRRWQLIKRGLCPACAYDLRSSVEGSPNCPECGKPMKARVVEPATP